METCYEASSCNSTDRIYFFPALSRTLCLCPHVVSYSRTEWTMNLERGMIHHPANPVDRIYFIPAMWGRTLCLCPHVVSYSRTEWTVNWERGMRRHPAHPTDRIFFFPAMWGRTLCRVYMLGLIHAHRHCVLSCSYTKVRYSSVVTVRVFQARPG